MKFFSKQFFITFILVALILISCWFFYKAIFKKQEYTKINNTKPDAIIENVTSTNYNDLGAIKSRIFSPQVIRYTGLKKTTFEKPDIILYHLKQKPWHINALKGKSLNNNEQLILNKHVLITQAAGLNNPKVDIKTSVLHIYPKKSIIETHAPVVVTQTSSDNTIFTLHSVGIRVNQRTGVIHLLSRARGSYAPAK